MSKQYHVYIPDEWVPLAEKLAKEEHFSLGTLFTSIIVDELKRVQEEIGYDHSDETVSDDTDVTKSDEFFHVKLRGDDAALLKRKANELGISPTNWLRNVIHRKDLTIYRIEFGDLREMSAIYGRLVSSIEGIVAVCRENNNVSPLDLERIIELMDTIRDQHIIVMTMTLAKRKAEKKKRVKSGLW